MVRSSFIRVSISSQTLSIFIDHASYPMNVFAISTALCGSGQIENSFCTPLGLHVVHVIAGINAPNATQFVRRIPLFNASYNTSDRILTRIFWLKGIEQGFNTGEQVDTQRRKIYIHATNEEEKIGQPVSHGCVRMTSEDILILEPYMRLGTQVFIEQ